MFKGNMDNYVVIIGKFAGISQSYDSNPIIHLQMKEDIERGINEYNSIVHIFANIEICNYLLNRPKGITMGVKGHIEPLGYGIKLVADKISIISPDKH